MTDAEYTELAAARLALRYAIARAKQREIDADNRIAALPRARRGAADQWLLTAQSIEWLAQQLMLERKLREIR